MELKDEVAVIDFSKSELKDFGFTFEEDYSSIAGTELERLQKENERLEELNKVHDAVSRELMKRIIAFTNNLKKSPEKPSINWPNRVEQIDKWIAELHEVYGKIKENNG